MSEGYFVIRTYKSGDVGEKTKFYVPGKRPEKNLTKKQQAAVRKAEQNSYSAQKNLARIINENFGNDGVFLGLDYSDAGLKRVLAWGRENGLDVDSEDETVRNDAVWEAAAHELEIAIRRVKRILKKQGIELKAISCTSDMDGDTGEMVRVHHHLIVQDGVQEAFVKAWEKYGLGGVSWTPFWENQIDRTPIAEYIIKQVRRIPDAKKYRCTRNLKRPAPKDRVVYTDTELKVPKGGKLIFRQEYRCGAAESGDYQNRQPQYIRYILPERLGRKTD